MAKRQHFRFEYDQPLPAYRERGSKTKGTFEVNMVWIMCTRMFMAATAKEAEANLLRFIGSTYGLTRTKHLRRARPRSLVCLETGRGMDIPWTAIYKLDEKKTLAHISKKKRKRRPK